MKIIKDHYESLNQSKERKRIDKPLQDLEEEYLKILKEEFKKVEKEIL